RDEAASELSRLAGERRSLLERIGIGEEDLSLLAAWTDAREAFLAARQRAAVAAAQLEGARATLERMPGFEASLVDAPEAALETGLAAARADAAGLEPLLDVAIGIRKRAERARSGSDVADALAAVDVATHALRESCARDMDAAAGAALVRFIQDTTRDQQRPRVFHRARDIFRGVTHGRWRLDLEEGDVPAFRAYDVERGVGHALGELSSATRMQLLVAVRLAFVEVQEREHGGARLPLLLDETLGTCDDARARAMIETVAALAREGRQLFYLTAQWDEVEKWHAVMSTRDVPVAVHHLHELRAAARLHVERPEWAPLPRPALPSPDGMTHAEYGVALRVPAISRTTSTIGGVHLWHLVDELPLLHRLLSLEVTTWGALESLVENGGAALLGDARDAWPRIRAAARALEAAHAAARIGHGRPVDRQAIIDSGVISDRFLDTVAGLAEGYDGDAAALVAHLASGQVKYFRTDIADRLREWFVEHGHLSDDEPLGREEITIRAMAAVAAELDAGLLVPERLHRLVAAVLPPVASNSPDAPGAPGAPGVRGGELPVAHPGLGGATARAVPTRSPNAD
ncbi:MAG TPA: hypothetical protein VFX39_00315, partial [Gemmatimonadaceae bacterium]|nr:hypothetical protein [Gemmatimonadaceae bacterium]